MKADRIGLARDGAINRIFGSRLTLAAIVGHPTSTTKSPTTHDAIEALDMAVMAVRQYRVGSR